MLSGDWAPRMRSSIAVEAPLQYPDFSARCDSSNHHHHAEILASESNLLARLCVVTDGSYFRFLLTPDLLFILHICNIGQTPCPAPHFALFPLGTPADTAPRESVHAATKCTNAS